MDLILCWFVAPVALLVTAAGLSLLVERISGFSLPWTIRPALGLATMIVVAQFGTAFETTAKLTLPAILVLAVVGLVVGRRLAKPWPGRLEIGIVVLLLLLFASPFLVSGEATWAGYIKLDDNATWLAITNHVFEHGRGVGDLPPGTHQQVLQDYLGGSYPIGGFVPMAVMTEITGVDLAFTIQSSMATAAMILSLVLFELSRRILRGVAGPVVIAVTAPLSALLLGYYLWGGVKEMVMAALLPLGPLLAARADDEEWPRGAFVSIALTIAAIIAVLGPGGALWAVPPLIPALVIVLQRYGVSKSARIVAPIAILGLLLLIPVIFTPDGHLRPPDRRRHRRSRDRQPPAPAQPAPGLGDLALDRFPHRARARGADEGDRGDRACFSPRGQSLPRAAPAEQDRHPPRRLYRRWRRRRPDHHPLRIDVGRRESADDPLARHPRGGARSASSCSGNERNLRLETGVAAAILVLVVAWGAFRAYQGVWLAPRDHYTELTKIDEEFSGGGPTLSTEVSGYGPRYFLRDLDPEGATDRRRRSVLLVDGSVPEDAEYLDLDRIRSDQLDPYNLLVIRRGPSVSRPGAEFGLAYSGEHYEVWKRREQPGSLIHHLPLGTELDAGAIPACGEVRELAEEAGDGGSLVAARVGTPIAIGLEDSTHPSGWKIPTTYTFAPDGSGTLTTPTTVPGGEYELWLGGVVFGGLEIRIDGEEVASERGVLNNYGGLEQLATISLDGGEHEIEIEYHGAGLWPGSALDPYEIGPLELRAPQHGDLGLISVDPASYRKLCGTRWDWIEAYGP